MSGNSGSRAFVAAETGFHRRGKRRRSRLARHMTVKVWICGAALGWMLLGASPVRVGSLPSGPNDGITDVPGVRVAQLTKIEGSNVRTGATGVIGNADPWNDRVAAATYELNGNGELTGAHWVDQAGFLETPIVLTDTL